MTNGRRVVLIGLASAACLIGTACYGPSSGVTYVGVSGPGPWYGYPYPGRYPGSFGGYIGVTVCCEEEQEEAPSPDAAKDAPATEEEEERPAEAPEVVGDIG